MDRLARLPLFFLLATAAAAPAVAGDLDPTGQWQVVSGESRYRITYCGDGTEICARLTWLRDDMRTEANVALLNRYVVEKARPRDEANSWSGVLTFDGETYEGTMVLTSNNSMRLYSCSGLICHTFELSRF